MALFEGDGKGSLVGPSSGGWRTFRIWMSLFWLCWDYSPSNDQPPISIAFDYNGGPKCWAQRVAGIRAKRA